MICTLNMQVAFDFQNLLIEILLQASDSTFLLFLLEEIATAIVLAGKGTSLP